MAYIAWFLWCLIWGLAGYLTVKVITTYIEKRRMEKAWAEYINHQRFMMRYAGAYNNAQMNSNSYISSKEEL